MLVKNFGTWLCYDSPSGTHDGYREYLDLTTAGAVTQCYRDTGAQAHSIQIIEVEETAVSNSHGWAAKPFHNSKIKFPPPHPALHCQPNSGFTSKRPMSSRCRASLSPSMTK